MNRVAVVSHRYAPDLGGVETLVEYTSKAMVRSGLEVEVWTQATGLVAPATELSEGVLVRRFPAFGPSAFAASPSLLRYARLAASTFDVLHVHNYHALAATAALAVPRDQPVVLSPHFHGGGHSMTARVLHKPYSLVGRRLVARADQVLAVSEAELGRLTDRFGAAIHSASVVHNGVDLESIASARPWPDEPPTALVLGRLEAYKNVDRTIHAFGDAPASAQLIIIGDGPDRRRLETLAGERVRFLGVLSRKDVVRWLRTARAVVSMSDHEAFGVVALEAAAAGSIALVSDIPAHVEVRDLAPAERIVVVPRDAALGPVLGAALAAPAGASTAVRSWDDVARDYVRVYRRLVTCRATGVPRSRVDDGGS